MKNLLSTLLLLPLFISCSSNDDAQTLDPIGNEVTYRLIPPLNGVSEDDYGNALAAKVNDHRTDRGLNELDRDAVPYDLMKEHLEFLVFEEPSGTVNYKHEEERE